MRRIGSGMRLPLKKVTLQESDALKYFLDETEVETRVSRSLGMSDSHTKACHKVTMMNSALKCIDDTYKGGFSNYPNHLQMFCNTLSNLGDT